MNCWEPLFRELQGYLEEFRDGLQAYFDALDDEHPERKRPVRPVLLRVLA